MLDATLPNPSIRPTSFAAIIRTTFMLAYNAINRMIPRSKGLAEVGIGGEAMFDVLLPNSVRGVPIMSAL